MNIEFTREEARVIGCLIEKQITTPDQYPLSLNALTNACNQKSNRDPVLALDEPSVQHIVDTLVRRHFVMEKSRLRQPRAQIPAPLLQHRVQHACSSAQELAIVCELLLRGPQTPGELRTRASRMATFNDTNTWMRHLRASPSVPMVPSSCACRGSPADAMRATRTSSAGKSRRARSRAPRPPRLPRPLRRRGSIGSRKKCARCAPSLRA